MTPMKVFQSSLDAQCLIEGNSFAKVLLCNLPTAKRHRVVTEIIKRVSYAIIVVKLTKDRKTWCSERKGLIVLTNLFINHSHICQSHCLIEKIVCLLCRRVNLLIKTQGTIIACLEPVDLSQ